MELGAAAPPVVMEGSRSALASGCHQPRGLLGMWGGGCNQGPKASISPRFSEFTFRGPMWPVVMHWTAEVGAGRPQAETEGECCCSSAESGLGFPGGALVKNPPANEGDTGSSPGPGGSHTP